MGEIIRRFFGDHTSQSIKVHGSLCEIARNVTVCIDGRNVGSHLFTHKLGSDFFNSLGVHLLSKIAILFAPPGLLDGLYTVGILSRLLGILVSYYPPTTVRRTPH